MKQALERNTRTKITLNFLAKRCTRRGDETLLDMNIMKSVRNAEVRAGLLTKSLRITHALWATNEYLSAFGKRDTDKCPLCGASNETNGHLKAHCPDESVKRIRERMVSAIAALVQNELGECMPDAAWQAIANQWNEKSLEVAYPEESRPSLAGVKCKNCRKGNKSFPAWTIDSHNHDTAKHRPPTTSDQGAENTAPLDDPTETCRKYTRQQRERRRNAPH